MEEQFSGARIAGMFLCSRSPPQTLITHQLFAEDASSKEPIAQFINATYDYREGTETLAELLMTERALEIRDTVMVSFLFLQKSKRIYDTATANRTATFGTPMSTLNIAVGSP